MKDKKPLLLIQKIPVIAFVANTGGLLGLCMGFSLVSLFEILYHILGALSKWWGSSPKTSEDLSTRSKSSWNNGQSVRQQSKPDMEMATISNNGQINKVIRRRDNPDQAIINSESVIQRTNSVGDDDKHSCERLL